MYEVVEYMAVYQKLKTHQFDTYEKAYNKKKSIEQDRTRLGVLNEMSE